VCMHTVHLSHPAFFHVPVSNFVTVVIVLQTAAS